MSKNTVYDILQVVTMELTSNIRELSSYVSLVDAAISLQSQAQRFDIQLTLQEAADLLFQHGWKDLQQGKR